MYKATFSNAVARPFRLDLTAWLMRRRAQNTISQWDGHTFQRVFVIDGVPVKVLVNQGGTQNGPQLLITLQSRTMLTFDQQVEAQLLTQKMLGVTVDLRLFNEQIVQDPVVWSLVGKFVGVRPTRFPTLFEALISAVVCQEASRGVGILILNRLVEQYGLAFKDSGVTMHAFPRPEDLLGVPVVELRQLGLSSSQAQTIVTLTAGVTRGGITLEQLELASNEEAIRYLGTLHGLSRWAIEYILVRGLGRLDVFPADDGNAAGKLRQLLALKTKPDYEKLKLLATAWHPYEGLVYMHLLLDKLSTNGYVRPDVTDNSFSY